MTDSAHRNLRVWKEARALSLSIYRVTSSFPMTERFGLTQQIRRSTTSVGANIAEGYGRSGKKEFKNFLSIARGSAKETEYFLLLAKDLGFLSETEAAGLICRYEGLCAGLAALAKQVG
ncbi:MAG: four helix bundle protein [Patescibacteria group bacterium]|jgi:four helix bundle protein